MANERVKMIDFQTKVPENQDFIPGIRPDGTHFKSTMLNLIQAVANQSVTPNNTVGF